MECLGEGGETFWWIFHKTRRDEAGDVVFMRINEAWCRLTSVKMGG